MENMELILTVAGAVVVVLIYVLQKQGQDLKNSYPPEVGEILKGFAQVILTNAEKQAALTPSQLDDDFLATLRQQLGLPSSTKPTDPTA